MIARVCVAVVAVALVAWLAVMERDARLQATGSAGLRPGATTAQLADAASDLRGARLLNPDVRPDIELALLYRARGDADRASAAIHDVVRREPDNLVAWGVVAVLARGHDPAALARAQAARDRLDPLSARRARQARP